MPYGFSISSSLIYIRGLRQQRTLNVNAPLNGSPSGPRPGTSNLEVLQLQSSAHAAGDIELAGIRNDKLKAVQFFVGSVRIHILSNTDDTPSLIRKAPRRTPGSVPFRQTTRSGRTSPTSLSIYPGKVVASGDYYGNGNSPFDITTGFDNIADGNFNDRPKFALPGQAGATATPFGSLVSTGGTGVLARNIASLPWGFHADGNIERVFNLTRSQRRTTSRPSPPTSAPRT